ncbi:amino acid ABC transporter permease [Klebsiella pneumoniae]|uniref:amino acid ABC transporter permease n=1 Tax=Klebsiella pneumoniae TaxID=573 RepID=UPI000DE71538|nr:amino acid ABC transporter permease [Klebsiella pneumoniae]SSF82395.1 cystine ABC transporter [Klebsiella pneumoniae]
MENDIISWVFVKELLPLLGQAALISVYISLASFCAALVIGGALLAMRRASCRMLRIVSSNIVEFFRLTPLLIHVYILFYILPNVGIVLNPIATGIVALGIYHGAFVSEIYRAALDGMPKGQWDALGALRFSYFDGMRLVILPQLFPLLLVVLGNCFIFILKDTAILAAISVPELMFVANQAGSAVFRYIEPMTMAALLYLIMSLVLAVGIAFAGRYFPVQKSYHSY